MLFLKFCDIIRKIFYKDKVMDDNFKQYIEQQGWEIMEEDADSVYLRHNNDSRVYGNAATVVLQQLKTNYNIANGLEVDTLIDQQTTLKKLNICHETIQNYIQAAWDESAVQSKQQDAGNGYSDEHWKTTFDLVFKLKTQVVSLLDELGMELDYYDPDSSYQDDVTAFGDALNNKMENINKITRLRPRY